jgi:hypothetical protein
LFLYSRYCRLLGLAPTFRVSGAEYAVFLTDSLNWLWRTAGDTFSSAAGGGDFSTNQAVAAAAIAAIGAFPLEATKLKMLPAAARAGLKLPPKYCATPAEAARRPEDVLPYVPAECWPRLLLTAGKEKNSLFFILLFKYQIVWSDVDQRTVFRTDYLGPSTWIS